MYFLTSVLNLCFFFLSFVLTVRRCCFCTSYEEITYSFGYAVDAAHVGVVTQHWEERRGDLVRGQYSLLDSDGRVRVVEYQVEGDRGFRAVVTFRPPGGRQLLGHLSFPRQYQRPVQLHRPVQLITPDLFRGNKKYSHLSVFR